MNTNIFDKNLDALAASHPAIANKMRSLVPVEIDYDAPLNDLIVEGEQFYGQDSHSACAQQVSLFFREPAHFSLKLTEKGSPHVHQGVINTLSQSAAKLGYRQNTKPQSGNLILLGSGLGYQISLLQKQLNFHNIILLEPNDEMLFHFLQRTNVAAIKDTLAEKGGDFHILQSRDINEFMVQFKHTLQHKLGFGFLAEVTVFRHYETPLFDHILEQFKPIRQKLLSNWGYYEDEINGVKHTYQNLKSHQFFTRNTDTLEQSKPIVLVGNGPSLDQHLALLKAHQNRFTVVSCGTAIAPLLNSGIVPNIHMEMERSQFTANVQQKWLNSEALKNVFFVGLSTVSPQITQLFKHSLLFTKANDLGTFLLNQDSDNHYPALHFCNPTVTNFALAASIKLGFENIYLLGCDYGYRDATRHHSTSSDYYASSAKIGYTPQDVHEVLDNFGKPISTTRIYDIARQNVENLLARHPNVHVTNCSDGAAILHTRWQKFSEAAVSYADNETSEVDSTKLKAMPPDQNRATEIVALKNSITNLNSFNTLLAGLRTLVSAAKETQDLLVACRDLVIAAEKALLEDTSYVLFIGDLRYYHLLFSGHTYRLSGTELNRYQQLAIAQLEQAISAYQELVVNLDS